MESFSSDDREQDSRWDLEYRKMLVIGVPCGVDSFS